MGPLTVVLKRQKVRSWQSERQLACTEMGNAKGSWVGLPTLSASGQNLFLYIIGPNNKHLKGFPWELALELNIIGMLAIMCFLIKATKKKNSTLYSPESQNLSWVLFSYVLFHT